MERKEGHSLFWIFGAFIVLTAVLTWGQQIMDHHYPEKLADPDEGERHGTETSTTESG